MDQFIAAVEVLRRPELAGLPVIVGGDGDPSKRGVVSTASYPARGFGIRSGMALRTAYRRCPEAIFLPVDREEYLAASARVMDVLRTFPAIVQVLGWDEAFMGVDTEEPEVMAAAVKQAVHERTALWCSVGVGDNRLRAKLATGFAKPAGVFSLSAATWEAVMGERPTEALWGVGIKTARRLAGLGIRTVAELAVADEGALVTAFGPSTGPWLAQLGRGEATSEVSAEPHVARGHSKERTYQQDLTDPDEIRRHLCLLARELAGQLADEGREALRILVKVRFAPFFTSSHSVTLPAPAVDPAAIERGALRALELFELDRPVRLLGLRAELAPRG